MDAGGAIGHTTAAVTDHGGRLFTVGMIKLHLSQHLNCLGNYRVG